MILNTEYKKHYDLIAYNTLAEKGLRSKIHVCSALKCTKDTLEKWINEQESFRNAIELGFVNGEVKFRDKLAEVSLKSSVKVNNNLLQLLADNVYNLRSKPEKVDISINKNTTPMSTLDKAEDELRKRGFELPVIELEDMING